MPDRLPDPSSLVTTNPNPPTPHPGLYACLYTPVAIQPAGATATLTDLAADFSPRYERHDDTLVSIDVSGLERLLGPARTIGEELRRAAASRGLGVHVAVAGTRTAAMVLALARPGVSIVERGGEAAALASVPIGILARAETVSLKSEARSQTNSPERVNPDRAGAFTKWGLRTLGELASLPPADLVSRFGRAARTWQAIARGEDVSPLIPTLAEERFVASLDLEWPVDTLEPLSFVLTRLLEPLSTRLERRDRGVAVLHVLLDLVTKDTYARRLELPSPMRDVRTLRTLALLDLEAHPPPDAIDRVTIAIDPTPGRVLQHTLFTRAQATPEQLSTLLARLGALMGQDRFGAPAVVDSYRPGAFAMKPFGTEWAGRAGRSGGEGPGSPSLPCQPCQPDTVTQALRRCRHPVPARVALDRDRPVRVTTERRGFAGGNVVRCAGPWRTSGSWWNSGAGEAGRAGEAGGKGSGFSSQPCPPVLSAWDRDEWDVSLTDGGVYRIFRDRATDAWFIDAVVD